MIRRTISVAFRYLVPGLILASVAGCSPRESEVPTPPTGSGAPVLGEQKDRSAGAFADTDPWVLKTTDPNAARGNHGIFLGNGAIGATFGGLGFDKDSVCYIAGVYGSSGDPKSEVLTNFPNISHAIAVSDPKSYSQELNLKTGVLTTKTNVSTVTAFALKVPPYALVINEKPTQAGVSVQTGTSPDWKMSGNGHLATMSLNEKDGSITTVIAPVRPEFGEKTPPPLKNTFDTLRQKQEAAWATLWKSDITIEGDPEAQQLIHKLMFDLLQSERPDATTSIPPESLSGDFYKGHIFWDAEVWMLPTLLPQHPELAKSMLEYRFSHLKQAQEQAKKQGCKGADFPWESAASGNETAPGGFSEGRHVTAGIGWAAWQYWLATGDKQWLSERGWPLLSEIADYFASRAKKNATTGKYDILKVFGPDENKGECDNNTYTNAMAANVLRYATEAAKLVGKPANPQWKTVADNLTLPFDKANNRYLARDGDKGEKTKQADGELLIWPAQLKMDQKTAEATFDFHKARPITNGPAMTDSIHALVAARLGRADEAEKNFRASYKPFVRGPFVLFSEKRSLDRCVFTTGAGGILQSVLYGFGGLDFSTPKGVIDGPVALPPTWKKLTISGIQRAGKRYTLTVTPQGRSLALES